MNLSSPEYLRSLIKEHRWHDQILYLRKLSVAKWRELAEHRKTDVPTADDEAGGLVWGARVLAECLCDTDGKPTHDTADKRRELEQLPNDEMYSLLEAALVWSGVWKTPGEAEEKKS